MQIRNRQRDALQSSLTPKQFGQAMAQLDLEGVPPHRRPQAIMNHLARIMAANVHDRDAAIQIEASRQLHQHQRLAKAGIITPTK